MIVTNYTAVPSNNEYILVVIQTCKFSLDEEIGEVEGEKVWVAISIPNFSSNAGLSHIRHGLALFRVLKVK